MDRDGSGEPEEQVDEETEPTVEQLKKLAADNKLAGENKKQRTQKLEERAQKEAALARVAELEAQLDARNPELSKLKHDRAVLERIAELRVLNPAIGRVLLSEISTVDDDGQLVDLETREPLTVDLLREILPLDLLPAKGVSGSGSKAPREVCLPRDVDPLEEAMTSQKYYDSNKAAVNARFQRGR